MSISERDLHILGLKQPAAYALQLTLLAGSTGLGVLAEVLFFGCTPGVSYPIFVAAFYTFFYAVFRGRHRDAPLSLFFLITVALLAMTYAWSGNTFFHAINLLIIPLFAAYHTLCISRCIVPESPFFALLGAAVVRPFCYVLVPFRLLLNAFAAAAKRKGPLSRFENSHGCTQLCAAAAGYYSLAQLGRRHF